MINDTPYQFTDAQKEEIINIVTGQWGGHIQTGFTEANIPYMYTYMYTRLGFNHKVNQWTFHPDGTVYKVDND